MFHVNWFLKGDDGKFMWPGFGDNSRVLKWILARVDGQAAAVQTPIGLVPEPASIDLAGIKNFRAEDLGKLLAVDRAQWATELAALKTQFHNTLMAEDATPVPAGIMAELASLEQRLAAA